ncbi:MAG: glycosyltransferase [Spirosomataceae bacterium]
MYKLSIAIVTRNRSVSLMRLLKNLSEQEGYIDLCEVLISDDSNIQSEIQSNKIIAEGFGAKYYSGPQNGLYANRNFVANKVKGTHFRTMDDDHLFPKNHLLECLKAIENEPNTIWTIGEYGYNENIGVSKELEDKKDGHPIAGQLHPRGYSYVPNSLDDYYGVSCGATIYPRVVVDNQDMNTEKFRFGKSYLEYGARLKYKGYKIKPLLSTFVYHEMLETHGDIYNVDVIKSSIYATYMLSFVYQPSLKNKFYFFMQMFLHLKKQNIKLAELVRFVSDR